MKYPVFTKQYTVVQFYEFVCKGWRKRKVSRQEWSHSTLHLLEIIEEPLSINKLSSVTSEILKDLFGILWDDEWFGEMKNTIVSIKKLTMVLYFVSHGMSSS